MSSIIKYVKLFYKTSKTIYTSYLIDNNGIMILNYLSFKYLDRRIICVIVRIRVYLLYNYWLFVNRIDPQVMFVGDSLDQSTKYILLFKYPFCNRPTLQPELFISCICFVSIRHTEMTEN